MSDESMGKKDSIAKPLNERALNDAFAEKDEFVVEETQETFSTWINKPYIPEAIRSQLARANVLIVPREGFREQSCLVFPVGTEELLGFLRDNADKGIMPDICITDEDYKELALHGALIIIGGLVVTYLIAPVVADLISEYIKRRWPNKENKARIKLELTVVKRDGIAYKMLYEGPAKDFKKTIQPTLDCLATKNSDRKQFEAKEKSE